MPVRSMPFLNSNACEAINKSAGLAAEMVMYGAENLPFLADPVTGLRQNDEVRIVRSLRIVSMRLRQKPDYFGRSAEDISLT